MKVRAELRYDVMEESGELCVKISGLWLTPVWCADNWDCLVNVRAENVFVNLPTDLFSVIPSQLQSLHTLVLAVAPYCWMMSSVLVVRRA